MSWAVGQSPSAGRRKASSLSTRGEDTHPQFPYIPGGVAGRTMKGSDSEEGDPIMHSQFHIDIDGVHFLALLTGHGPNGSAVVDIARGRLEESLKKRVTSSSSQEDVDAALEASINEAETAVCSSALSTSSGLTLVLCAVLPACHVTIALVGDSDVVLGAVDAKFTSGVRAISLCNQHNVKNEDELKRVLAHGMECDGSYIHPQKDGEAGSETSLAMTRCLGNTQLKATCPGAVIATPTLVHHTYKEPETLFLLAASSGLFAAYPPSKVVNRVARSLSVDFKPSHLNTHNSPPKDAKEQVNMVAEELTAAIKNRQILSENSATTLEEDSSFLIALLPL